MMSASHSVPHHSKIVGALTPPSPHEAFDLSVVVSWCRSVRRSVRRSLSTTAPAEISKCAMLPNFRCQLSCVGWCLQVTGCRCHGRDRRRKFGSSGVVVCRNVTDARYAWYDDCATAIMLRLSRICERIRKKLFLPDVVKG